MSAHTDHLAHGHDDHHDDHGEGEIHFSFRDYMTGFVLAVILTAIPFWLVMGEVFESSQTTAIVILALAGIQVVVHMVYFLHMNARIESGWTMISLIFTLIVVVIMLAGSLWVMFHLDANMMPGHEMLDMMKQP